MQIEIREPGDLEEYHELGHGDSPSPHGMGSGPGPSEKYFPSTERYSALAGRCYFAVIGSANRFAPPGGNIEDGLMTGGGRDAYRSRAPVYGVRIGSPRVLGVSGAAIFSRSQMSGKKK